MINNAIASKADLDELDLLLIQHLEADARQTTRDLGAKLGVSASTVSKRLRKMTSSGVIKFFAMTEPMAMGLQVKALLGLSIIPGKSTEVAQHLATQRRIQWFSLTMGRYDMVIYALFRDNQEMLDWLINKLGAVSGVVSAEEMIILKRLKSHYHPSSAESGGNPEVTTQSVDELELKLLRELESSPRESIGGIARNVGVSRWIATRRLATLFEKKVTRIVSVVDPRSLGLAMSTCIFVRTHLDKVASVAQALAEDQRIMYLSIVTGHFNVIAYGSFPDLDAISHFVTHELGNIPGVIDHETMIMVGHPHQSPQLMS